MDKELLRLYKIVAGSGDIADFTTLLNRLAEDAADVRVSIPDIKQEDSLAVRKAVHNYLRAAIDILRRQKENKVSSSDVADEEL